MYANSSQNGRVPPVRLEEPAPPPTRQEIYRTVAGIPLLLLAHLALSLFRGWTLHSYWRWFLLGTLTNYLPSLVICVATCIIIHFLTERSYYDANREPAPWWTCLMQSLDALIVYLALLVLHVLFG